MSAARIEVRALTRPERLEALDDLARIRIAVFAQWPYLYQGDAEYERTYLQPYVQSDAAIVVGALDDGRLIGAATGTPLVDHADEFADAFRDAGIAPGKLFYCAESVLLPAYRGRGIGCRFFELREAHGDSLGLEGPVFCAVQRPGQHPARPAAARDLAPFWTGRGYRSLRGIRASYSWKDIGAEVETAKPMQFWGRPCAALCGHLS